MRNLIVNADDFGISPLVNASIWKLVESEIVNGVSVIPNGYAIDDAIQRISMAPNLRVSLHLNICEATPLNEKDDVDLIIDGQGFLNLTPKRFYKLYFASSRTRRTALLQQIEREFRTQIAFYLDSVKQRNLIIDSHLHMHLLPQIQEVIYRLQNDFVISSVRRVFEPSYRNCRSASDFVGLAKRIFLNWCSNRSQVWNVESNSEITFGIFDSLNLRTDNIHQLAESILKINDDKSIDLICHPGQSDYSETYWNNRQDFRKVYVCESRKEEAAAIRNLVAYLRQSAD
jgi:predicted glycoside hydrolase/deacetylase ChbG (UPF0249 family)